MSNVFRIEDLHTLNPWLNQNRRRSHQIPSRHQPIAKSSSGCRSMSTTGSALLQLMVVELLLSISKLVLHQSYFRGRFSLCQMPNKRNGIFFQQFHLSLSQIFELMYDKKIPLTKWCMNCKSAHLLRSLIEITSVEIDVLNILSTILCE